MRKKRVIFEQKEDGTWKESRPQDNRAIFSFDEKLSREIEEQTKAAESEETADVLEFEIVEEE